MLAHVCVSLWGSECLILLYLLELRGGVDGLTNNSNTVTVFHFSIKGVWPVLPIRDYSFGDLRAWSDLHFLLLLLYIVGFSIWA